VGGYERHHAFNGISGVTFEGIAYVIVGQPEKNLNEKISQPVQYQFMERITGNLCPAAEPSAENAFMALAYQFIILYDILRVIRQVRHDDNNGIAFIYFKASAYCVTVSGQIRVIDQPYPRVAFGYLFYDLYCAVFTVVVNHDDFKRHMRFIQDIGYFPQSDRQALGLVTGRH
jgi:hypothetical protein